MRNPAPSPQKLTRAEEEKRDFTLTHAGGMLRTARNRGHYIGLENELQRLSATSWPFELANIGTTEAEVQKLSHNGLLPTAESWLQSLRHRHSDCRNDLPVMMVREYLRLANATPEAIGSTEAELLLQEEQYP